MSSSASRSDESVSTSGAVGSSVPLDRTSFRYSIVIPVFNSESIVSDTIGRTLECLRAEHVDFELILVNDGSSDRSWELVRTAAAANPEVVGIDLLRNVGQ